MFFQRSLIVAFGVTFTLAFGLGEDDDACAANAASPGCAAAKKGRKLLQQKRGALQTTVAAETSTSETCMYEQYSPWKNSDGTLKETYTEAQYWIGICLIGLPPGSSECQACIDQVWCNEDALCWDSDLEKALPCIDVSLEPPPVPRYLQCKGSPAPAPFSMETVLDEYTRCHADHRTTGRWGDLGEKVTKETCLERCGLWKSCKYVTHESVFEPCVYIGHGECAPSTTRGMCTSFTDCSTTEGDMEITTWKKVTEVAPSGCEYAQYTPWKNSDGSLKEHYTEPQYWADICLVAMPPGHDKCQQCIDKVWCNKGAMCWDQQSQAQSPCPDVSLQYETFPNYPQCPGSEAPDLDVEFDQISKVDGRCGGKFRTSGRWGDLGEKVSLETCFHACRLWKSCKFVSFEPRAEPCIYIGHGECAETEQTGMCTSFSACTWKKEVKGQTTYKKGWIDKSSDCKDKNKVSWCKKFHDKCDKGWVQKLCKKSCGRC